MTPGLAYISNVWKPFWDYTIIERGKRKGQIRVVVRVLGDAGFVVQSLVGHVHVRTLLQRPFVAEALFWLDRYCPDGILREFAPVMFIRAELSLT